MINFFISGTLRFQRGKIMRHTPTGKGGPVHKRDHPVKHHLRFDIRPVEGLHKRLRQRQSRCFDDNMIRARSLRQKLLHARQKVIGNGAADTAIRQFDDILGTAAVRATFFQHRTIHADVPEFIDNQRQPAAIRLHDDVADQRRFSGP
ncbi:MAG: Uncharacterised protein [SAR116 cluster bacterium]|nr:MAG: Uncharacterised protein [SAR116 cluster bacterium]